MSSHTRTPARKSRRPLVWVGCGIALVSVFGIAAAMSSPTETGSRASSDIPPVAAQTAATPAPAPAYADDDLVFIAASPQVIPGSPNSYQEIHKALMLCSSLDIDRDKGEDPTIAALSAVTDISESYPRLAPNEVGQFIGVAAATYCPDTLEWLYLSPLISGAA